MKLDLMKFIRRPGAVAGEVVKDLAEDALERVAEAELRERISDPRCAELARLTLRASRMFRAGRRVEAVKALFEAVRTVRL